VCNRKEFELCIYSNIVAYSRQGNLLEKSALFEVSRKNIEWLKENYDRLKKDYDNRWVVIQNGKVVESASTFEEIMKTVRKRDPNKILVEYIQSKPVAMFF